MVVLNRNEAAALDAALAAERPLADFLQPLSEPLKHVGNEVSDAVSNLTGADLSDLQWSSSQLDPTQAAFDSIRNTPTEDIVRAALWSNPLLRAPPWPPARMRPLAVRLCVASPCQRHPLLAFAQGFASSMANTLCVTAFCVAFFVAARSSQTLQRQVYAPRAIDGFSGAAGFPGARGVFDEVHHCTAAVRNDAAGLEAHMLVRYVWRGVRLLLWGCLIGAPMMPTFAVEPASVTNWILQASRLNCTVPAADDGAAEADEGQLPEGCVRWWSYVQRITIAHVPNGSWRLVVAGAGMLAFALIYVADLTYEWRFYAVAKQRWLARRAIEGKAVLVQIQGEDVPAAETLAAEIARLVGEGEVVSVASVESLRLGESGTNLLEQKGLESLQAVGRGVGRVGYVAKLGLHEASGSALSHAFGVVGSAVAPGAAAAERQATMLARLLCCGEDDEPHSSRFMVLFASRRAASLCVSAARWPGEMLFNPGYVRVHPAPSPSDVYWPNVLMGRRRATFNKGLSVALTFALFTLYPFPVAFVQGLASVHTLVKNERFRWLARIIQEGGPKAVATFEGFAAALVLQSFLYGTLYSGLFQWLARLRGAYSQTTILSHAAARMFLFQLIFVLLISVIVSSVWDSLSRLVENPTELPYLLAGYLPAQSTFFFHYILNSILFVALFDVLQLLPLLNYALQECCCRCASWRSEEPDEVMYRPAPHKESDKRRRLALIYAKLVLTLGIALVFLIVAPLAPFLGLLYFLLSYPLYAMLFLNVFGSPEVDSAGAIWEQAIRYETWALLISQLLLLGIVTLKGSPTGAVCTAIALTYTMRRTHLLRRRYSGLASSLPLQRAAQLDDMDFEAQIGVPRSEVARSGDAGRCPGMPCLHSAHGPVDPQLVTTHRNLVPYANAAYLMAANEDE